MSLSRRYGIINIAYHGSFHDGKELYTMSNVKRKDSKNRNLRNGESQRKDGRLCTRYISICKSRTGKTGLLISELIFTTHLLLLVAFSCW